MMEYQRYVIKESPAVSKAAVVAEIYDPESGLPVGLARKLPAGVTARLVRRPRSAANDR